MKITLCGSIAFYDEMRDAQRQLRHLGHRIKLPPAKVRDNNNRLIPVKDYYSQRKAETDLSSWIWARKTKAMRIHFNKIAWCDGILVLNYRKNRVANYIGANTLLEMGLAFYLHKKIFLFNPIPQMSYTEEILGLKPIIIHRDLTQIK